MKFVETKKRTPYGTRIEKRIDNEHCTVAYEPDRVDESTGRTSRRRFLRFAMFLLSLGLIR